MPPRIARIRRHNWPRLVAKLVPGAVVADSSGMEARPVQHVQNGPHVIYVSADRSRSVIELQGLSINIRKGSGNVAGDIPYLGTHLAGPERKLLDNLAPSRARENAARTLGEGAVEAKLDEFCRTSGADFLNSIRDRARHLAPLIDREDEFRKLNAMIGTCQS